MKQPAVIFKTANPSGGQHYPGIYYSEERRTFVYLLGRGSVQEFKTETSDPSILSSLFRVTLDRNQPILAESQLPFQYESFEEILSDKEALSFYKALAQDPLVQCEAEVLVAGAKKKHAPRFILEIPSLYVSKKATDTKTKATILASFVGLTEDEKREVCWYFEVDPRDMTEDDILVDMAGDGGKLYLEENASRYINKFVESASLGDANTAKVIAIKKAMIMSQKEQDPMEYRDGNYYHGETYIGKDLDSILAFFEDNKRLFDSLIGGLVNTAEETKRKPRAKQ
jgi:hypothetical protein